MRDPAQILYRPPYCVKKTRHPSCFNVSAHGDQAKSFLLTTSLNPRQFGPENWESGPFPRGTKMDVAALDGFQKSFFFWCFFVSLFFNECLRVHMIPELRSDPGALD